MVELVSFGIFLAATTAVFLLVWRKIPILLQIPPQLIEESFVTRPSSLSSYAQTINVLRQRERYAGWYRAALIWVLHRVRLWLLRFERFVFGMIETVQEQELQLSETEERYWNELKQWKQFKRENGETIPTEVFEGREDTAARPKPRE